jgi:hypothetical protein
MMRNLYLGGGEEPRLSKDAPKERYPPGSQLARQRSLLSLLHRVLEVQRHVNERAAACLRELAYIREGFERL